MLFGQTLLITFEGLDGSGKTTLLNAVANELNSRGQTEFKVVTEPGCTGLDDFDPRKILKNPNIDKFTEVFIHNAYRRDNVVKILEPSLKSNISVLQDRFALSTYAYNVFPFQAEMPDLADLFMGSMTYVIGNNLPEPLTFLVDTPKEIRMNRMLADGKTLDRYEDNSDYQDKVAEAYENIKTAPSVVVLDGTKSVHALVEEVIETLIQYNAKKDSELQEIRDQLEDAETVTDPGTVGEGSDPEPIKIDVIKEIADLAESIMHELKIVAKGEGDGGADFSSYKSLIVNTINNVIKHAGDPNVILTSQEEIVNIKQKVIPVIYYGNVLRRWELLEAQAGKKENEENV